MRQRSGIEAAYSDKWKEKGQESTNKEQIENMRVLWVCNIMLPVVARELHRETGNKEGWLTGLMDMILRHQEDNKIELGVCFPEGGQTEYTDYTEYILEIPLDMRENSPERGSEVSVKERNERKKVKLYAYGFYEDIHHAEIYSEKTEEHLKKIIEKFEPDIVHCFGTEYPHTLAAIKAFNKPERTLVGIQGICCIYAQHYRDGLPDYVWKRSSFRDIVKRDNLRIQQKKFEQRGIHEKEALRRTGHIAGRTEFDFQYAKEQNPKAVYHVLNETLRPVFYEGRWQEENCRRYSIFLSQGDYPLKGLHYMISALPELLKSFPETEVYVAGNSIIKTAAEKGINGLKGKLKLESYGKYILQLLKETGTLHKVHFLGPLNAEQMKKQYLSCQVFVCPSAIENSPNSVGEAMLLGVPSVSADVGGISSLFTDGADGILYPAGDVEKLAEAVMKIFADSETAKGYTEAAREHARKTHDGEKNYNDMLAVYENMMPIETRQI